LKNVNPDEKDADYYYNIGKFLNKKKVIENNFLFSIACIQHDK
jgi:hypothetical protein